MARSESKPKVGYVLRKFPVLSETFVLNEILSLESHGVPIQIFSLAPPRDPKFHDGVVRLRASIVYVPGPGDMRGLARYARAARSRFGVEFDLGLLRALATGRPKMIWRFLQAAYVAERAARLKIQRLHAHFASRSTTVARLAARLAGIPYSFTAHAFDIYRSDVSPEVLRRKIEDASFVVTISESNEKLLRDVANGAGEKIRLLHNGIDLTAFAPATSPAQSCFSIVSVARLVEKKGLPFLIEACRLLAQRGIEFRCRIIGRGKQRPLLTELIRSHGLEDRVELRGAVRQGDAPGVYQQADVYVLPAIVARDGNREGLPVSIVEALACGVPVISTPVSGISEVVRHEHNGLLVPERDATALAAALERVILDDELRARLRYNARPSVAATFDMQRTSRSLQRLFAQEVA